jgi:hypothetical protein
MDSDKNNGIKVIGQHCNFVYGVNSQTKEILRKHLQPDDCILNYKVSGGFDSFDPKYFPKELEIAYKTALNITQ